MILLFVCNQHSTPDVAEPTKIKHGVFELGLLYLSHGSLRSAWHTSHSMTEMQSTELCGIHATYLPPPPGPHSPGGFGLRQHVTARAALRAPPSPGPPPPPGGSGLRQHITARAALRAPPSPGPPPPGRLRPAAAYHGPRSAPRFAHPTPRAPNSTRTTPHPHHSNITMTTLLFVCNQHSAPDVAEPTKIKHEVFELVLLYLPHGSLRSTWHTGHSMTKMQSIEVCRMRATYLPPPPWAGSQPAAA